MYGLLNPQALGKMPRTNEWLEFARDILPDLPPQETVPAAELLDIAIELEKRTMALYVGFVQAFPRPEEVRNFWFSMARHEAGHCGALALVEAIVESDPARATTARVWFDEGTVARAGLALERELKVIGERPPGF